LETEWAQRAFISSYMLGVMDNYQAFCEVHTLNLARISSHCIPHISRDDFWDSLPCLQNVTILALAEWRSVSKDEAGYVDVSPLIPSRSVRDVEDLLINIIAPRRQITTLNVGWASGGEQATGVFGRNQHLMPSPVMPSRWVETNMTSAKKLREEMILFPSVQHLTLTNCWIVPAFLALFIKNNTKALQTLTLDSVSLSPHVRDMQRMLASDLDDIVDPMIPGQAQPAPPVQPAQPQQAGVPPLAAQAVAVLRAQFLRPAAGPANGQHQVPNHGLAAALTAAAANAAAIQQGQILWNQAPARANQPAPAANPIANPVGNQAPDPAALTWRGPHTVGSWPWLLDCISPGIRIHHVTGARGTASIVPTTSCLKSITLKSCGYARVSYQSAEALQLDVLCTQRTASLAWKRSFAYVGDIMGASDSGMGQVSQYIPELESEALQRVWGMTLGWDNEEAKRAVFYDGYLAGGSGRFSGTIDNQVPTTNDDAMEDD
jgi:hypothetical protein